LHNLDTRCLISYRCLINASLYLLWLSLSPLAVFIPSGCLIIVSKPQKRSFHLNVILANYRAIAAQGPQL
jgi:hypothetical protein